MSATHPTTPQTGHGSGLLQSVLAPELQYIDFSGFTGVQSILFRPHKSGALILTGNTSGVPTASGGNSGVRSGAPVSADSSRAMP